jgi:hypothetical protein
MRTGDVKPAIGRRCASNTVLARRAAAIWESHAKAALLPFWEALYKVRRSVLYRDLRQAVTGNRERILPGAGEGITGNRGSRYRDSGHDLPGIEAEKLPQAVGLTADFRPQLMIVFRIV